MKLLMENWRNFLAEEEKNCGCGQDPCITYGVQNEAKEDEGYEPHMMYNPKTGEKKKAKTKEEHESLGASGWQHVNPDEIRKALEDEGGAADTDAIVDRTDASGKEVKKAMKDMPDVAQHDKGDYILGDKDKIKIEEDCWDGYERVPGSKEGEPGSCRKKTNEGAGHAESILQAQNQGVAFIRGQDDKAAGKEKDPNYSEESGRNPLEVLFYNAGYDKGMDENFSSKTEASFGDKSATTFTTQQMNDEEETAAEIESAIVSLAKEKGMSAEELKAAILGNIKNKKGISVEQAAIDEAEICKAGKDWVDGKEIGGQVVKRGEDGKFNNWSARAAQIASNYCKNPNYGRGKKKKKNESMSEGDLGDWEKENWTHSDGTPCGGGDKDGSQSRCKPASKWKGMSKGEKAADNAKKKAGTDAGKQYVSATKKGKVTKAHTKEAQVADILARVFEGCGEPAPVNYDHGPEASMHRSSLHTIKGEVEQLLYMIGEQDDLPEWLEAKITKAKAYLSAAKDYLSGEQAEMAGALEEQLADAIVVEYLEEDNMDEGGRCTKATEKTTSTRKGKKYMKCIKNPDGEGYIRKHWGQKGARAAPKGSKRNKSFNKRHKCSTAKAGTARKLACDDW